MKIFEPFARAYNSVADATWRRYTSRNIAPKKPVNTTQPVSQQPAPQQQYAKKSTNGKYVCVVETTDDETTLLRLENPYPYRIGEEKFELRKVQFKTAVIQQKTGKTPKLGNQMPLGSKALLGYVKRGHRSSVSKGYSVKAGAPQPVEEELPIDLAPENSEEVEIFKIQDYRDNEGDLEKKVGDSDSDLIGLTSDELARLESAPVPKEKKAVK